jgi:CHASE3 domain sensor protein
MNKLTIRNRLLLGFAVLIILFVLNGVVSIAVLQNNKKKADTIALTIEPTLKKLDEFSLLILQSKMYATNWVYLQSKEDDKAQLKLIHNTTYPEFKKKIDKIIKSWSDTNQISKIKKSLNDFEAILATEKEIMDGLSTFESYEDPMIKLDAESKIEEVVLPKTSEIINGLNLIKDAKIKEKKEAEETLAISNYYLSVIVISMAILLTLASIIIAFYLANSITNPIVYVKDVINDMGKGKLTTVSNYNRKDEIGDMISSLNVLSQGIKYTSEFAQSVGNSNFDAEFKVLSEDDELGHSLISMRDNLKKAAEEDRKRAWATSGVAEIGTILRSNFDNVSDLYNDTLRFIVKYLGVNQGGLFELVEDSNEPYLELVACFAYERKKFIQKKVYIGEGLVGQCAMEVDKIFLTDVPDDYVNITSGLGQSTPKCILIVPLKVVDTCVGVLEIASFNVLEEFEINFVEKICETIATSISTNKINERTKKLLEESQQQSEELRSQEEEMRQNMEELHATQEEMQRKQTEMEQKLADAAAREQELLSKLNSVTI